MSLCFNKLLRFRSGNVTRHIASRRLHSSQWILEEMKQEVNDKLQRADSSDVAKTFKSEDDISNIQERTLFENVFERIMEKERQRELSRKDVMNHVNSIPGENGQLNGQNDTAMDESSEKVQIVFGQDKKQLSENDKRMLAFFRKSSQASNKFGNSSHANELATLTTDDIRKYPVSLVSRILDIDNIQNKELKMDTSILGKFANSNSSNFDKRSFTDEEIANDKSSIKETTLNYLKKKHIFKMHLDEAMNPYIDHIVSQLNTDHDLLEYFEKLIIEYRLSENKMIPTNTNMEDLPETIKVQCETNPTTLPVPLDITVPYIINTFLSNEKIKLPLERRYYLASFIHNECKQPGLLSLYLSVCNVEFYNILLQLTWENFSEIYSLNQLIAEMTINGVMGNLETIKILDKIIEELQYLNDDILHEEPSMIDKQPVKRDKKLFSNIWCRENTIGLSKIEKYLFNLKNSLV